MTNLESRTYLPEGQLYSINNHNIHVYGAGKGKFTIVFLAGSGTPAAFTDFYVLQRELQPYARTVSYDHAGFGWSEKTSRPRTIDTVVEELHELLLKAGEAPPYILVGHSLASLEAIRYAQTYPNEVNGMMLLDGGSPEYYAKDSEIKAYLLNRVFAGLRVTGVVRALGAFGVLLPFTGEDLRNQSLPSNMKSMDAALYYAHIGDSSNLNAIRHMNENARSVMEEGYLTDIPLYILSSDSGADWEDAQKQLLRWSNRSHQETLPHAKHYIHWSSREAVLGKKIEMLNLSAVSVVPEGTAFVAER